MSTSFQFAPRKMVDISCDSHVTVSEPVVYGNQDIYSPSGSNSTPSSPLVQISGCDTPDSPLSPPILRTQSYDEALFDLRKVPPEKIAGQLTLIDLNLFKAIRMTELTDCNWTKKDKETLAPGVVAFTRRFNHTSFWVVREILNEPNTKARGELMVQFIRIAKKLLELNNIHSLKAVMAGLQSGPIYRLSQTWKLVSKKDKINFEKFDELLSADENWQTLRAHLNTAVLPCIPHLGLYLTDLMFVSGAAGSDHKEESIRNLIAYFQNSTYDCLTPEVHVQKYLLHKRYIDELQKFYEEDNYKLSQEREPNTSQFRKQRSASSFATKITSPGRSSSPAALRLSKSHEDILAPFNDAPPLNLTVPTDPQHSKTKKNRTLPNSFRDSGPLKIEISDKRPLRPPPAASKRVHSEESGNLLSPVDIPDRRGVVAVSPGTKRKFSKGHKKASSLGSNVLQMLGVMKHSAPSPTTSRNGSPHDSPTNSRNLIDDSLLGRPHFELDRVSPSGSLGSLSSESSEESGDEEEELYRKLGDVDEVEVDYLQARLVMEGPLKKKLAKKSGRISSFGKKSCKVWAQLTDSAIVFLASKPKHRKSSKLVRTKGIILKGWEVRFKDEKNKDKQFIIFNESGTQLQFKASSLQLSHTWVERISQIISGENERERRKAEESLIIL